MKNSYLFLLLLGFSLCFMACDRDDTGQGDQEGTDGTEQEQGDDDEGNGTQTSMKLIKIRLTDNPIDLAEVNIDLQEVILVAGDQLFLLDTEAGIYNLLDFQNGIDTLISDQALDIDYIRELVLRIGTKNSIVTVDGQEFPLVLPDGHEDYLTIEMNLDLEEFDEVEVLLDFDACRSVHLTDGGLWVLEPVLTVKTINGADAGGLDADKIKMIKEELDINVDNTDALSSEIFETSLCLYDFKVIRVDVADASVDAQQSYIFSPNCEMLLKARTSATSELGPDFLQVVADLAPGADLYQRVEQYTDMSNKIYYQFKILDDTNISMLITDAVGELICRG